MEALRLFVIGAWRSWFANRSQFARFLRIFCLPVSAQFPKQPILAYFACNVAEFLFILQNRAPTNRITPKSLPKCASRTDKVIPLHTSYLFHVHAPPLSLVFCTNLLVFRSRCRIRPLHESRRPNGNTRPLVAPLSSLLLFSCMLSPHRVINSTFVTFGQI